MVHNRKPSRSKVVKLHETPSCELTLKVVTHGALSRQMDGHKRDQLTVRQVRDDISSNQLSATLGREEKNQNALAILRT